MTIKVDTYEEALVIAQQLRADYAGTDWVVTIDRPLFAGDKYRVTVG